MPVDRTVGLSPITSADVHETASFFHANLNRRLTARDWAAAMVPPWSATSPNHGFLLRDGARVVGAYLAFYSVRNVDGSHERVCNLAAWCVLEEYRSHSLRLVRAMLSQRGYTFTDLSPSGNVVAVNERLGFAHLDTTTALVPAVPWPMWSRDVRVVAEPDEIARTLSGRDRQVFLEHRNAGAAKHVVVVRGGESCYVIFRRDRRKRIPMFGSILYVSDTAAFRRAAPWVFRHMLLRHGLPFGLAELRVVGARPRLSVILRQRLSRPKMYKSSTMQPERIDYLYSELTCVPW